MSTSAIGTTICGPPRAASRAGRCRRQQRSEQQDDRQMGGEKRSTMRAVRRAVRQSCGASTGGARCRRRPGRRGFHLIVGTVPVCTWRDRGPPGVITCTDSSWPIRRTARRGTDSVRTEPAGKLNRRTCRLEALSRRQGRPHSNGARHRVGAWDDLVDLCRKGLASESTCTVTAAPSAKRGASSSATAASIRSCCGSCSMSSGLPGTARSPGSTIFSATTRQWARRSPRSQGRRAPGRRLLGGLQARLRHRVSRPDVLELLLGHRLARDQGLEAFVVGFGAAQCRARRTGARLGFAQSRREIRPSRRISTRPRSTVAPTPAVTSRTLPITWLATATALRELTVPTASRMSGCSSTRTCTVAPARAGYRRRHGPRSDLARGEKPRHPQQEEERRGRCPDAAHTFGPTGRRLLVSSTGCSWRCRFRRRHGLPGREVQFGVTDLAVDARLQVLHLRLFGRRHRIEHVDAARQAAGVASRTIDRFSRARSWCAPRPPPAVWHRRARATPAPLPRARGGEVVPQQAVRAACAAASRVFPVVANPLKTFQRAPTNTA